MKSIQTKFTVLMISGLLTMSLLLGGTCLMYAGYEWKENLKTTLNTVCEEQTLRMDNQLDTIKQSATIIYNYAQSRLPSVKELQDDEFLKKYTDKVSALAENVADHTDGTLGVYFHYNPELIDPKTGFFWSRNGLKGTLQKTSVTDLSKYTEKDEDKTCWYYQPAKAGKPTWTHTYYNETVGVEMISYGIPFYMGDILVGVMGIDVDFSYLVDLAQEGAIYENGRGNLVDLEQRLVYFRKPGDDECTIRTIDISDHFYNTLKQADSNKGKLLPFSYQGAKFHMTYQTLNNGMKSLTDGTKQMKSKLGDASPKLLDGIKTVKDGSGQISNGASTLASGSKTLGDGIITLADGTKTLKDGAIKLNKDGISKITDIFGKDAKDAINKIEDTLNAGKDYKSFSGINEGMDGSVKFIFKTAEIKADK